MRYINISIYWFLFWSIIATIFAPSDYQLIDNLISDLSTNYHSYPLFMDLGFYGFGVLAFIGAYDLYKKNNAPRILILFVILSSISMMLIALFDTQYPMSDVVVIERGISLHALFAASQEGLFILVILYHIKHSIGDMKRIHLIFLSLSLILSLIFMLNIYPGLFQRLIFVNNGIWFMLYFLKLRQTKSA